MENEKLWRAETRMKEMKKTDNNEKNKHKKMRRKYRKCIQIRQLPNGNFLYHDHLIYANEISKNKNKKTTTRSKEKNAQLTEDLSF